MVWMIRGKGTGKVSASIKLLVNKESLLTIVNQISLIISIILITTEKMTWKTNQIPGQHRAVLKDEFYITVKSPAVRRKKTRLIKYKIYRFRCTLESQP